MKFLILPDFYSAVVGISSRPWRQGDRSLGSVRGWAGAHSE